MQKSALLELQERYKEVMQIYRGIIASTDFDPVQRAWAKNNLAYLLAAGAPSKKEAAEALKSLAMTGAPLSPFTPRIFAVAPSSSIAAPIRFNSDTCMKR